MRRHWKTILIAMAVAVLGLSVVAVAYGATQTTKASKGRAACGKLMSDPKAVQAMQGLRTEHQAEMQAWSVEYRDNPTSADAQNALTKLRQEHWNDMRKLFKDFGIEVPAGTGPGARGGQGGMMGGAGSCGGADGGVGCAGPGSGAGSQGTGYGNGMMGGASY